MKKILLTVLFLGLVAVVVSGMAKKEKPAQKESAAVVKTPVKVTALGIRTTEPAGKSLLETVTVPVQNGSSSVVEMPVKVAAMGFRKTDPSLPSALEKAAGPTEKDVAGNVTAAAQSSTQAVVRETGVVVGGVAASTQSATQDAAREGSAVLSSVTSAALSSSQPSASKEGAPAETPAKVEAMGVTVTDSAAQPVQKKTVVPGEKAVAGSVTSATQSSTQAGVREGGTIVGGVAASTQSSTQDGVREKSTITSGVTSAALSSAQVSAPGEGVLAEEAETVANPAVSQEPS